MTKKFNLHIFQNEPEPSVARLGGRSLVSSQKPVFLVRWCLTDKDDEFDRNDIIAFVLRLGLTEELFDHLYRGVNYSIHSANKDYELSLFYSDIANEIFISIICNNSAAKEKVAALLKEVEELDHDDLLHLEGGYYQKRIN